MLGGGKMGQDSIKEMLCINDFEIRLARLGFLGGGWGTNIQILKNQLQITRNNQL